MKRFAVSALLLTIIFAFAMPLFTVPVHATYSQSLAGGGTCYAHIPKTFTATVTIDGNDLLDWIILSDAVSLVYFVQYDRLPDDTCSYFTSAGVYSLSYSRSWTYDAVGNTTTYTVTFDIAFEWGAHTSQSMVLQSYDHSNGYHWHTTTYPNFFKTITSLSFSNLAVSTYNCVPSQSLTFTGMLYYSGTVTVPADGDYNVQILLSGITVATDHTLVSGTFSASANAPGSAGSYTYSCSASGAANANFGVVSVGYLLSVSQNGAYGTTSPSSGLYNPNVVVSVSASANTNYAFDHWLIDGAVLRYDNPHSVTMDTDHGIEAFFVWTGGGSDTAPPTFGSVTANVTFAGAHVMLSCPVADNVALSAYKFGWNNSGVWVNQTAVLVSGASVTATLNGTWNVNVGYVVSVQVYANDSSNNWGMSVLTNFTLSDSVPPTYSNVASNSTVAASTCQFSTLWADNLNVSGAVFESNMTGSLVNSSWTVFTVFQTSTSAWSNTTASLPSVVGNVVAWQFFCNDSWNNWNATGLQYVTLTAPVGNTALVTFHENSGGLTYVNGVLTADGTILNCTIGSSLSLAAVANSGYSFAGFSWTGGNSLVSPASYVVPATNDTVWTFFNVVPSSGGGSGGGGGNQQAVVVHVQDSYVTLGLGSSASFSLTVSWTGGGSLTVSVVSAQGNFSGWISSSELPKTGGGGVLNLNVECSLPEDASPTGYAVPVALTVQSVGGGSVVSGTVYVTVSSGTPQLSLLEEIMTVIFILVGLIAMFWGYVFRHH